MFEKFGINEKEVNESSREFKKLKKYLKTANAIPIFPFKLDTGFVDYTNFGVRGDNSINDYNQFQRVFNGSETPIATWENSIKLEVVTENSEKKLKRTFQRGNYFFGMAYSINFEGVTESNSSVQQGFSEIHDKENIEMVIPDYKITEEDLYKFYIIPTMTNRWMRITSATRHYNFNNELIASSITMDSIDTKMFTSGASQYETLLTGAIGGNYAWPSFKEVDNETLIDFEERINKGVNNVQMTWLGDAAIGGVMSYGRPKNGNYIEEQRPLLPIEILQPITTAISKNVPPITDYGIVPDAKLTLNTYLGDWKEDYKQRYNLEALNRWEGLIHVDGTDDKTSKKMVRFAGDNLVYKNDVVSGTFNYKKDNSLFFNKDVTLGNPTLANIMATGALNYMQYPLLAMDINHIRTFTLNSIPIIGGILNKLALGTPWGWNYTRTRGRMAQGLNLLMAFPTYDLNVNARYGSGGAAGSDKGYIPLDTFDNSDSGSKIVSMYGGASTSHAIRYKMTHLFSRNDPKNGDDRKPIKFDKGETYVDFKDVPLKIVQKLTSFSKVQGNNKTYTVETIARIEDGRYYLKWLNNDAPPDDGGTWNVAVQHTYYVKADLLDTKNLGITWHWEGNEKFVIDINTTYEVDNIIHHSLSKCDMVIGAYNDNESVFDSRYQTIGKFKDNVRAWSNSLITSPYHTFNIDLAELGWEDINVPVETDYNSTHSLVLSGLLKIEENPITVFLTLSKDQYSLNPRVNFVVNNDSVPVRVIELSVNGEQGFDIPNNGNNMILVVKKVSQTTSSGFVTTAVTIKAGRTSPWAYPIYVKEIRWA